MVTAMASAKLANTHPYHHQHLVVSHPAFHHMPIALPTGTPSAGQMTLDYSLPNRSRVSDSDQSELPALIAIDTPPKSNQSDEAFGNNAADQQLSPQRSASPAGSESRDHLGPFDTPTKKNKRKLSEPKKRSDINVKAKAKVKRPCQDDTTTASEKQSTIPKVRRSRGVDAAVDSITSNSLHLNHSYRPSSPSSSSSLLNSFSSHKKKSPSPDNPPGSSSSALLSLPRIPSAHAKSSASEEQDRDSSSPTSLPPANGIPAHLLHPLLAGVPPAAYGLVPGLYFGGQALPRTPLASPFPAAAIPFHIQQNYIAAAAAAAAQAQAQAQTAASASSSPSSAHSSSKPSSRKSETPDSSPFLAHQSSAHPNVILQRPQPSGSSSKPSPHPSSSQSNNNINHSSFASSSHYNSNSSRPKSARSTATTDNQNDDDDDDSMSQVHSPEDLTLGGKMSAKHRKNYKNMTRERRVEANARERTRVHTISAAFDALRRAVPSYSYNQKLSKLAILRIASTYIMSLARLSDLDYTSDSEHIQKPLTFAECVDMCTNTIQTEGRARRRH